MWECEYADIFNTVIFSSILDRYEWVEKKVDVPSTVFQPAGSRSNEESSEDEDEGFGPRPMLASTDALGGVKPHGGIE